MCLKFCHTSECVYPTHWQATARGDRPRQTNIQDFKFQNNFFLTRMANFNQVRIDENLHESTSPLSSNIFVKLNNRKLWWEPWRHIRWTTIDQHQRKNCSSALFSRWLDCHPVERTIFRFSHWLFLQNLGRVYCWIWNNW